MKVQVILTPVGAPPKRSLFDTINLKKAIHKADTRQADTRQPQGRQALGRQKAGRHGVQRNPK